MADYGRDLAAIHDEGYTRPAELGARRLVAELASAGISGGVVVDLGCGSGVSSRILSDAGYDVLGIDPSQPMLDLAAEAAPDALFKRGDAATALLPRCVGVGAFGEPLNYVRSEGEDNLPAVIDRVHEALRPGGIFAFDLAGPARGAPREIDRDWSEDDGWAVLVERTRTDRLVRRRITTFREEPGNRWRRSVEFHLQRLHPAAEVLDLLREAGFRARSVIGWDGVRERPGHTAFVARRPT
jgi:SAM-dependent methyltransferase